MLTAVNAPIVVWTLVDICLRTTAPDVVQPNLTAAYTVDVIRLRSDVPDNFAVSK